MSGMVLGAEKDDVSYRNIMKSLMSSILASVMFSDRAVVVLYESHRWLGALVGGWWAMSHCHVYLCIPGSRG